MDRFLIKDKRKKESEKGLTAYGPVATTSSNASGITSSPQSENRSEQTSIPSSRKNIECNNDIINSDSCDLNSEKENCGEANCTNVVVNENNNLKIGVIPQSFSRWQINYPWLLINHTTGKAICSSCVEAINKKLPLPSSNNCANSRRAYVEQGFDTWKNALKSFRSHENSELHRSAITALATLQQQSIVYSLSSAKKKEMVDARVALRKIFSTVKVLAKQGLALRGSDNDERSNLVNILKMRAEDVPELNTWLNRTGHTWIHHDIINEILELFANQVMRQNLEIIKSADFYAITLDETSDISRLEQVSICIRIALDDLTTKEIFMGFYSTENTKSQTLFDIVNDVLTRYDLKFSNLRGQCYDGASNVSGRITGLQTRIRDVEPRALYVHCNAHTLNLVVQDAFEHVSCARNFIGIVKDVINFIRDSPKRLAQFKNLQSEGSPKLTPFCPTRWCMRIKSLKTIHDKDNYAAALAFFEEVSSDRTVDCSTSAKAAGFIKHLETFEFYFLLSLTIDIFQRIEILNTELQKSNLSVNESHKKVRAVIDTLTQMRESKFDIIWHNSTQGASALSLGEPKVRRSRNVPKRLEESGTSNPHNFHTPKDYYRKMYFEIFDQVMMSMNDRFNSKTMMLLNSFEDFAVGKNNVKVQEISQFYNSTPKSDTKPQNGFDEQKLQLHREIFLEITNLRKVTLHCLKDVIQFLQDNPEIRNLVPEYTKFIRVLLTIPASSCSNERSFSDLKRLKSYLRSTMLQKRLNHIATLYIHQDIVDNLNMEEIINNFIKKNKIRAATFAM